MWDLKLPNSGYREPTAGWAGWMKVAKSPNCKISKSWGSNVHHADCSYQNCIVYFKVAKRVVLKLLDIRKKKTSITIWGDWILTELTEVVILQYIHVAITVLYTWNYYNAECRSYLSKIWEIVLKIKNCFVSWWLHGTNLHSRQEVLNKATVWEALTYRAYTAYLMATGKSFNFWKGGTHSGFSATEIGFTKILLQNYCLWYM